MKLRFALEALLPGWVKRPEDAVEAIETCRDYCRKRSLELNANPRWTTLHTILDVAADQAKNQR